MFIAKAWAEAEKKAIEINSWRLYRINLYGVLVYCAVKIRSDFKVLTFDYT